MLSSHDLCGCYLHLVKDATEDNGYRFIINRDVNRCLYEFLESVGRLSTEEIDFAISINTQVNPNKLWILYRTSEQLERQELNSCQINFFKSFLNDLCSNRTVNADPFYDINTLLMHGTNPILPQNNNFVHIYKE
jgi:hypothetical protein